MRIDSLIGTVLVLSTYRKHRLELRSRRSRTSSSGDPTTCVLAFDAFEREQSVRILFEDAVEP